MNQPDVEAFTTRLREERGYFDSSRPIVVARAPGRLDVMGGIADYSGSLVLELPLADATLVAAQENDAGKDARIVVRSLAAMEDEFEVAVSVDLIAPGGQPLDYATAHALLAAEPRTRWSSYVLGAFVVLARERGMRPRGMRLLVDSRVPVGKGVASSAAIEVAAMRAICALERIEIDGRDLGILCQMVENLVVGAPCGVMDQMTSACGEANRLLALLCQPAEIVGHVALPDHLEVWGIDSGIRHEIGGADYGAVRVATFMGYRIMADIARLRTASRDDGRVAIDDPLWKGYLANVPVREWAVSYSAHVPASMSGADFLDRYNGISDPVTRVDPSRIYAVRQCANHAVTESYRVGEFRRWLNDGASTPYSLAVLGGLMYASHASYGACGLGSSGTDRLVSLVRGSGDGLIGAKITGGGSGGTVAVLARTGSRAAVERVAEQYARETGRAAAVLGGSSDGAMRSGVAHIQA
ncbi:MAG TPA: galactokinase family protein [Gemmatimonadaceae bacterium]|jgi:L-arabinokinase|nr:galactokinase family protein [Gemmatimonadaceae bacterium]